MQGSLFGDDESAPKPETRRRGTAGPIGLAATAATHRPLAERLPATLRLGTSSWYFPGWAGLVWNARHPLTRIRHEGLAIYAQHPLLRSVCLDRGFYRPMSVEEYGTCAAQVPDDFRFVVKAPNRVADAVIRGAGGRGASANPDFLDPRLAVETFAEPALRGLGDKLGVLLFQFSPLPSARLRDLDETLERLAAMLNALPAIRDIAPDAVIAVELRNGEPLADANAGAFAAALREAGARYCIGLHPKMPPIEDQLAFLERLPPGPLVCRWNLHRRHGAYGYEDAKRLYGDFDRIVDPDPQTRDPLAAAIAAATAADHLAYVTIGNKAEGSAPLSALALAEAIVRTAP